MAYMGNSRPASGSEHHLSHFFEIVGLLRDEPYFCHGIDVAYSTYITSRLRQELLALDLPVSRDQQIHEWESNIYRVYKGKDDLSTADGIIAMQKRLGWIYENKFHTYKEKWQEIRRVLSDSPTPQEISEMLLSIDLPIADFERTYSKEKLDDAIRYAKDLKDRYSVLWLYDQVMPHKIGS